MLCRKALILFALLFTTAAAYCQSEAMKAVVNNLAFYKQKSDLNYLSKAKKSVDSLIVTKADSSNLQKNVYKALVYTSIAYLDSTNKLNQPADFVPKTAALVDKISARPGSYKYQAEIGFSKRCMANVFIRQGFDQIYRSDFYQALRQFQKAQSYVPSFSPLNAYIGYVYSKSGNLTEAAKYYQQILSSDSTKAEYIEATSSIYKQMGDTAKAIAVLQHGVKILPQDKNLLLDVANIYSNQKEYKLLQPILPKLLDANPSSAETAFIAADCYDHLNQPDKAESLYMRAIELNGAAYAPVFNLGLLYLKQSTLKHDPNSLQNMNRAIQWLEKANEILPNNVNCLQVLQIVYSKAGNTDQLNRVNYKLHQLTN